LETSQTTSNISQAFRKTRTDHIPSQCMERNNKIRVEINEMMTKTQYNDSVKQRAGSWKS
jgi:hypothetical protein